MWRSCSRASFFVTSSTEMPLVAASISGRNTANIQLSRSFQLIQEVNAVATSFGGPNGTNGTLALRWLAGPTTAVDLYASNASGLLDLGQLLGTDQIRIGGKVTVQF